jgi:hypothetical protein
MRKIVALAVLAGFLAVPAARVMADDEFGGMERTPAASSSAKHKKKKKKTGKKKSAKKHAGHSSTKAHASKGKSHAPKSASAMPSAPQYPTQPGAGNFNDIPNEKKDDLPPPAPVNN